MAPIEHSFVDPPLNRTGTSEMGDLERERRVVGLMQVDMARLEAEVERLREADGDRHRLASFIERHVPGAEVLKREDGPWAVVT